MNPFNRTNVRSLRVPNDGKSCLSAKSNKRLPAVSRPRVVSSSRRPDATMKVYAISPIGNSMSMPMSNPGSIVAPDPPLTLRRKRCRRRARPLSDRRSSGQLRQRTFEVVRDDTGLIEGQRRSADTAGGRIGNTSSRALRQDAVAGAAGRLRPCPTTRSPSA